MYLAPLEMSALAVSVIGPVGNVSLDLTVSVIGPVGNVSLDLSVNIIICPVRNVSLALL